MRTLESIEYFKKFPVFSTKTISARASRGYINLYLHRLEKKHLIERIEKNLYTIYKDPFLIASRIVWPSYISCWSSLKFHNLTEQVPNAVFVIAPYYKKTIIFQKIPIYFIATKSKNIFGYEKVIYKGFEIFIADKEKAIIDSALFKKASFSELQEIISHNLKQLSIKKFLKYLKKIGNKSLIKRLGYVLDILGKDCNKELKKYVDKVYIPLDYAKKKSGIKNKKWMIVKNA